MEALNFPRLQLTIDDSITDTINARDLHSNLKVGRDFSTWIKDRISRGSFVEGKTILSPNRG